MFPRAGGIWNQDPTLMRDFRRIQKFEREWKESQEQIQEAKRNQGQEVTGKGGGSGVEDALNEYLESLGEEGTF